MAESWRAKANRYARGDFTKAELMGAVGVLLVDQAIDVATFGRLNALKGKAFVKVALPLVRKTATRAVPSVGRAAFGASRLLMTNPYILGGTALYVGFQERERIKQLLDQGYEIVKEEAIDPILQQTAPGRQELFETMGPRAAPLPGIIEQFRPKPRKPSTFNKAVSAGMRAVKGSTSYGKRGVIKPAKKAFALVTKLASAKKKKKKAPKSGIRRRIWNAMKGLR
jgi:hypothetical protein